MARLGLQRQTEAEIALEFFSDLGVISDGSPVVRDDHGSFVQGLHRAELAGVKSLNQRRDDAFGFSGERIGLGHRGLLFMLVELRCGLCRGVSGHAAARSTLITQLSRSLVLINALGTTGILIPKALNAARMRAAWIASIHAIPASSSIMYGDFNFAASLTYPTAAPISSASASLAMLTSLSTLP